MRKILLSFAVAASIPVAAATPANAAELLVSATSGSGTIAFLIDETPTPFSSTTDYFAVFQTVTLDGGSVDGVLQFWTNPGSFNGGFTFSTLADFFYTGSGPALFSGPTSSPTLILGSYTFDGGRASITLSGGVPEPETWGVMLLGLAGVGAALRRSRRRGEAQLQAA